jgi:hypothetical protein
MLLASGMACEVKIERVIYFHYANSARKAATHWTFPARSQIVGLIPSEDRRRKSFGLPLLSV